MSGFSLLELFKMGGVFMWPLLVFSIATVAIAVDRIVFLAMNNLKMDDLKRNTENFIRIHDYGAAKEYLAGLGGQRRGARILSALVSAAGIGSTTEQTQDLAEKAAEAEAGECVASLESGFNYLVALGSLSPLTGFLGTVSGMIGAFRSIAQATDVNAQIVANGIYEALITTVFGLIIAIVAMVAHSIFTSIVDRFAADVEKTCSDLIIEVSGGNAD
jgi:biopolymer transport protein ExbB